MSRTVFMIRSPLLGLAVGLGLFAALSLLREAIQPHLGNESFLGGLFTVVTFVLPGAVVGALSPRHTLMFGVVLGVLVAVFATLEVGHFSHVMWTARPTLRVFVSFAGMGIILCELGALAGRVIALKWLSFNNRMERQHEI